MKHKECDDLMWILDQVARYSHDVDAIFWLNSSGIKSVGLFGFFPGKHTYYADSWAAANIHLIQDKFIFESCIFQSKTVSLKHNLTDYYNH